MWADRLGGAALGAALASSCPLRNKSRSASASGMDSGLVGSLACVGYKHLVNGNALVIEGIAARADLLIPARYPFLKVFVRVE